MKKLILGIALIASAGASAADGAWWWGTPVSETRDKVTASVERWWKNDGLIINAETIKSGALYGAHQQWLICSNYQEISRLASAELARAKKDLSTDQPVDIVSSLSTIGQIVVVAVQPIANPLFQDYLTYSPLINEVEMNAKKGIRDLAQSALYVNFNSGFSQFMNVKGDPECSGRATNLIDKLNDYLKFRGDLAASKH